MKLANGHVPLRYIIATGGGLLVYNTLLVAKMVFINSIYKNTSYYIIHSVYLL